MVATVLTNILHLDIKRVEIPENLFDAIHFLQLVSFLYLKDISFLQDEIGLALIASAETLFCPNAVNKMHQGEKTKYNQDLAAQGVGNMLCGLVSSLPMT